MSIQINEADNALQNNFLMFAKLAGITQEHEGHREKLTFEGQTFRIGTRVDQPITDTMGGKVRALQLHRYAALIQHLSAAPQGEVMAGIMKQSFNALGERYPALRSYSEGAAIRARQEVWIRW
jgi:hypothetical protein